MSVAHSHPSYHASQLRGLKDVIKQTHFSFGFWLDRMSKVLILLYAAYVLVCRAGREG